MSQNKFKNIKRVLIANRGEIALRILHACKSQGLETVCVFSEPDEWSLPVRLSDFAVALGGKTAAESYLDIPKIIQALKQSGADAVHPGYGFLSENANFAKSVVEAGARFIGPSPQAIADMGDKVIAKKIVQAQNIPTVPGSPNALTDLKELQSIAHSIGYPLILKAAAGGGGRGMRIVRKDEELEQAFAACQREAQAYFSNPAVFCERYIENPRHIEVQVLCDLHGNGVHLFERDCSIQRRHQKLIEEAPSTYLNTAQRTKLGELALKAAKAVNYSGVGTVEFICENPENTYFMEMNTRIQVEHPVTEMITGVDLIVEQLKVADGQTLTIKQEDIKINGWSIECRINAEDASQGFMPKPGKISSVYLPRDPKMRIDSHIENGYEIPAFYDSMIAKFISHGSTREAAIQTMLAALKQFQIQGVPTTASIHEEILTHPDFIKGDFTTRFIEKYEKSLLTVKEPTPEAALVASVYHQFQNQTKSLSTDQHRNLWSSQSIHDSMRRSL